MNPCCFFFSQGKDLDGSLNIVPSQLGRRWTNDESTCPVRWCTSLIHFCDLVLFLFVRFQVQDDEQIKLNWEVLFWVNAGCFLCAGQQLCFAPVFVLGLGPSSILLLGTCRNIPGMDRLGSAAAILVQGRLFRKAATAGGSCKMGLLKVGTPLHWDDMLEHCNYIRRHGSGGTWGGSRDPWDLWDEKRAATHIGSWNQQRHRWQQRHCW